MKPKDIPLIAAKQLGLIIREINKILLENNHIKKVENPDLINTEVKKDITDATHKAITRKSLITLIDIKSDFFLAFLIIELFKEMMPIMIPKVKFFIIILILK